MNSGQMEKYKKLALNTRSYLFYNDLPLSNRGREPKRGYIDNIPCVIFHRNASVLALEYLMAKYPELERFSEVREYAPTIIDTLVTHEQAYYFETQHKGRKYRMVTIKEGPLWEGADDDLYDLINLIHYAEDSAANPGGVFMDDYGLC